MEEENAALVEVAGGSQRFLKLPFSLFFLPLPFSLELSPRNGPALPKAGSGGARR